MWDSRGGPGKGSAGRVWNLVAAPVLRQLRGVLEATWAPGQTCSRLALAQCALRFCDRWLEHLVFAKIALREGLGVQVPDTETPLPWGWAPGFLLKLHPELGPCWCQLAGRSPAAGSTPPSQGEGGGGAFHFGEKGALRDGSPREED